jgi:hypothetical protein
MRRAHWLSAAAALALAACASAPPEHSRHGPSHPGAPDDSARLFISPAGQPFRRGPGLPPPAEQWRNQADRNHDGVLDRAELVADAEAFFKTLDIDGDGVITEAEITRYETEVVPEILGRRGDPEADSTAHTRPSGGWGGGGGHGRGGGRGGGGGGGHGGGGYGGGGNSQGDGQSGGQGVFDVLSGAAAFSLLNDPEPLLSADYDLNHRITLAEFQRKASEVFDLLDRNHDGKLDAAELTPRQRARHSRQR